MHETHTHQTIPEGRDTDAAQPIDCALNYVERFQNRKVRAKKATPAEKVPKAMRAKTDAPSAGRQATRQKNVGSA